MTEAMALEMREDLSEGLRQLQPELLEVIEPHFDRKLYQIPVDRKLEDADHARERLDQLLAFARDETATLEA